VSEVSLGGGGVGLYTVSFTPDAAGKWRLKVVESTIPYERVWSFDVAASTAAEEVWDESLASHATAGTTGANQNLLDDVEADTQDIQSRLPAALVGGRMDSDVGAIQANAITASALAADAVDEIVDQTWDEATSGHTAAGTFGNLVGGIWADTNALERGVVLESLSVSGSGSTPTVVNTTSTKADGFYDGDLLVVRHSSGAAARRVLSYVSAGGTFTLDSALPFTPASANGAYVLSLRPADNVSVGEILVDTAAIQPTVAGNLDAAVSSRSSHSAADVDTTLTGSHGAGGWTTATGFSTHTANDVRDAILSDSTPFPGANVDATVSSRASQTTADAIETDTQDLQAKIGTPAGASVSADIAGVQTGVTTLLGRVTSTLFSGITSLAEWLGLLAGKQVGDATARTEVRATGAGSGTYDETTDSQEAISDNAGGSAPTAAAIADAVWEEAIADHSGTAGSTAESLADVLTDTADIQPKIGTPTGASLAADIAAAKAVLDGLNDVSTADLASAIAADPGLLRVVHRWTNRVDLDASDGSVTVYDDAGVAEFTGLAYSDVAQTVLYNGTAPVVSVTRLT
jgi:hypothetical protein